MKRKKVNLFAPPYPYRFSIPLKYNPVSPKRPAVQLESGLNGAL